MADPAATPSVSAGLPWWMRDEASPDWWKDDALTDVGGPPTGDDVVLLDEAGRPRGTAPRATVHSAQTPRHLAFSCWVTRGDGAVLLTRRTLTKATWPGVWTNSFCGHPRPGESVAAAVIRHARHELGLELRDLEPVLPGFRYRAVDASGVVENEICPVFRAVTDDEPRPHPDEVMDLRWVPVAEVDGLVRTAPWVVSPWMVEQVRALGSVPVLVPGGPR